jgi:hypothetical protein
MIAVSILIVCGLTVGILLSIEVGYRFGRRRWTRVPETARMGASTLEGAIFGLMGLLIAFTFYGAGFRFDTRRTLVAEEANAIGTAYLRIDVLPENVQPAIRESFRKYVRSRLAVYEKIPDVEAVNAALDRSWALQRRIWEQAVMASREVGPAEKSLVLQSLNAMIDITTVRTIALMTHPPLAVFVMLALAVVASSVLAGYSMSANGVRNWPYVLTFAIVAATALYVILDYEFPRVGLINVDAVDQLLAETLEKME